MVEKFAKVTCLWDLLGFYPSREFGEVVPWDVSYSRTCWGTLCEIGITEIDGVDVVSVGVPGVLALPTTAKEQRRLH